MSTYKNLYENCKKKKLVQIVIYLGIYNVGNNSH